MQNSSKSLFSLNDADLRRTIKKTAPKEKDFVAIQRQIKDNIDSMQIIRNLETNLMESSNKTEYLKLARKLMVRFEACPKQRTKSKVILSLT